MHKHLRDQPKPHHVVGHALSHAESQTRQASEKRWRSWDLGGAPKAALAAAAAAALAAMATTMTAKRGPSGGEVRGAGGRARACPIQGGEADHPSAAALRASLSTRDQVRSSGVRLRGAHARVLQCRPLPTWRIGAIMVLLCLVLVVCGALCSCVLGYCGRCRRLRKCGGGCGSWRSWSSRYHPLHRMVIRSLTRHLCLPLCLVSGLFRLCEPALD